jgi:hypothetical protein
MAGHHPGIAGGRPGLLKTLECLSKAYIYPDTIQAEPEAVQAYYLIKHP